MRLAAPAFVYALALLNVQLGGTVVQPETEEQSKGRILV
jgi:hypothetical protein